MPNTSSVPEPSTSLAPKSTAGNQFLALGPSSWATARLIFQLRQADSLVSFLLSFNMKSQLEYESSSFFMFPSRLTPQSTSIPHRWFTTKKIPLSEVAKHTKPEDAWIAIYGKVYDATKYIRDCPDVESIMEVCSQFWSKSSVYIDIWRGSERNHLRCSMINSTVTRILQRWTTIILEILIERSSEKPFEKQGLLITLNLCVTSILRLFFPTNELESSRVLSCDLACVCVGSVHVGNAGVDKSNKAIEVLCCGLKISLPRESHLPLHIRSQNSTDTHSGFQQRDAR